MPAAVGLQFPNSPQLPDRAFAHQGLLDDFDIGVVHGDLQIAEVGQTGTGAHSFAGRIVRSPAISDATGSRPRLPWLRSVAWLLVLGPFFFLSYGYANHMAAGRAITDSVFFEWERQVPFLPWTIIPYWSIDLFYG